MRKLGKGQSVIFCVPQEIKMKILQCSPGLSESEIKPQHVLTWSVLETFANMRRNIPLWATQGRRFERQQLLWTAARNETTFELSKSQAEQFLELEAQTLEYRYSPHTVTQTPPYAEWAAGNQNLARIEERCSEFGPLDSNSATLQEEQERELAPEIEQERHLERPDAAEAKAHSLHPDVQSFAATGKLKTPSPAFLPAFKVLDSSSAASFLDVSEFSANVLSTMDFAHTINYRGKSYVSDDYLQPIQWVLTTSHPDHANTVQELVIISSFEAEELLQIILERKRVTLHIYAPRINLGYRSLDSLDLFTLGKPFNPQSIPRRLITQLNLFAGQLYFNCYEDYKELCKFLNLAWKPASDDMEVAADSFITSNLGTCGFSRSPVQFLKVLMTKIRRNCDSIDKTHMGKILGGEFLTEEDFEE